MNTHDPVRAWWFARQDWTEARAAANATAIRAGATRAEAEDIAQTACERAVESYDPTHGAGLIPWLCRVAARLAIDAHRSRRTERHALQRAAWLFDARGGYAALRPDVLCEAADTIRFVRRGVDTLTKRQARALTVRYLDECEDNAEFLAETGETSLPNTWSLLRNAYANLWRALGGTGERPRKPRRDAYAVPYSDAERAARNRAKRAHRAEVSL